MERPLTECADLELSLRRGEGDTYSVEMRFDQPGSDADVRLGRDRPANVKFDFPALRAVEWDPEAYGKLLSQSLFAGDVRSGFDKARAAAQAKGMALRLRLWIHPSVPKLHTLHWETLRDPEHPSSTLFTGANLLFSRYLSSQDMGPVELLPKSKLRALVAIANPSNLAEHDLAEVKRDEEFGRAETALGGGPEGIPVTCLPSSEGQFCTLEAIMNSLRGGYDILYLVAHGTFAREIPRLVLEGKDGKMLRASGEELANRIRDMEKKPRLVVLASCESAGDGTGQALQALGPLLVEAGVPAVVAMQGGVTMGTVEEFMPVFFDELQKDGRIDRAMAVARGAVRDRGDFWIPVLFMRLKSGRIWQAKLPEIMTGMVGGYGELRMEYDTNVQNFLEDYLGTQEKPVPFGGREQDLDALDRWLKDADAPHYALLAEPAGRGKSALLCHWVTRLASQDDPPHIIFFPVSIRAETNLEGVTFAALAARASYLLGEKFPQTADVRQYRGLFADFLRRPPPDGKPVLLVLDGLDEAAGWKIGLDIFPPNASSHLKVLVAARPLAGDAGPEGWLNRLGWRGASRARIVPLGLLSKEGLREVLEHMGNPLDSLAARFDIVEALHYLSGGDPLVIRLYVEALADRKILASMLRAEDVRRLEPGLEGFFTQWFEEQRSLSGQKDPLREKSVRGLLSLCAAAIGPLHRDDILALAPDYFEDAFVLEGAARDINRFVIGDGIKAGYVFSHPRLGEYFSGRLGNQRAAWRNRFLDYGEKTVEGLKLGIIAPQDVAAYVLQYYPVHLEEAGSQAESFEELICPPWEGAWLKFDGTHAGFLNDVLRAWEHFKTLDQQAVRASGKARYLGKQIRCALIESSLHSLVGNIPADLIPALVRDKIWSLRQAWVFIRQMPDSRQQAGAITALLPILAKEQLEEALEVARAIGDESQRAYALSELAGRMPEVSGQALAAARAIGNEGHRAIILSELAKRMPEVSREALEAARAIGNERQRASVLDELARRMPDGQLPQVLEAARAIDDGGYRAHVLGELARRMPEVIAEALEAARAIGDMVLRASILSALAGRTPELSGEALDAARAIGDEFQRAYALSELAGRMPEVSGEALDAARAIRDEWQRAYALSELAERMPEVSGEALEAARTIRDEGQRAEILNELAGRMPEGQLPQVLETARGIGNEGHRAIILSELAKRMPEVSAEALEAARTIGDEEQRAYVLRALAGRMPEGQLPQVLETALAIGDQRQRASVLRALTQRMPEGQLSQVLEAAHVINDQITRARLLSALAERMPEVSGEALEAARTIRDEGQRAEILTELAGRMPGVSREAIESARVISDAGQRAYALGELAGRMLEVGGEALEAAWAIGGEGQRASVLSELARRLPESQLPQVLEAAQAIGNEWLRVYPLSALAGRMREEQLSQVLEAAQAISDEITRARVLSALAGRMPEGQLPQVLEAAWAIGDEGQRASVLRELAPRVISVDRTHSYAWLEDTIPLLSRRTRPNFLSDLAALMPLLIHVGGEGIEREIYEAVQEVSRWWR